LTQNFAAWGPEGYFPSPYLARRYREEQGYEEYVKPLLEEVRR